MMVLDNDVSNAGSAEVAIAQGATATSEGGRASDPDAIDGYVEAKAGNTCAVPMYIGDVQVKLVCDTGCGRNLMRADVARALRRSPKTQLSCGPR